MPRFCTRMFVAKAGCARLCLPPSLLLLAPALSTAAHPRSLKQLLRLPLDCLLQLELSPPRASQVIGRGRLKAMRARRARRARGRRAA